MPAAATTALAVLAASAAPHGAATITFDGALADGLRAQGVAVARRLVLPAERGRVANRAALVLRGSVTLRAGRKLGARRVTLSAWRADVRAGRTVLSAAVSGAQRRTLLRADVPRRRLTLDATTGTVRLQPVTLRLTRVGGRFLRTRLGLDERPTGVLGTLRVAIVLGGTTGGGQGGGGNGGGGPAGGRGTGGGGGPTPPHGCTPGFSSGTIPPAPAPLARPAGAIDIASATLTWRPRESFIQYVASGEGATASDGATAGPLETVPGNSARLVYSFGFGLKPGSWYDPATGSADLLGQGTVRFLYRGHGIDISVRNPEIELNGRGSRAIFAFSGGDCTQIAPVRGVMLSLVPGNPSVNGPARDYGTIPATITDAGATMFSGFYLPGDPWGSLAVAFAVAP
ncbi:MAG TPA: HtaA domain-containing protein [Conexibacter sp.]|nr:HtaA domain-containing protein [Conexibacter sp.]